MIPLEEIRAISSPVRASVATVVLERSSGAIQAQQMGAASNSRPLAADNAVAQAQAQGQRDLEEAVKALAKAVGVVNERLAFSLHRDSGIMYVQVIDNKTNEIIKQIPPDKVMDAVARIRDMIGMLLDERV